MSVDSSYSQKSFRRIVTIARPLLSRSLLLCRFAIRSANMLRFRILAAFSVLVLWAAGAFAQSSVGGKVETKERRPPASQVVREARSYREANEDRIMRELRELLAIPNVASDTP